MKRVAIAVALTAGAAVALVPLAAAGNESSESSESNESNETAAVALAAPKQGLCVDLSPLGLASICIGQVL